MANFYADKKVSVEKKPRRITLTFEQQQKNWKSQIVIRDGVNLSHATFPLKQRN
jgi:hypothetical protein